MDEKTMVRLFLEEQKQKGFRPSEIAALAQMLWKDEREKAEARRRANLKEGRAVPEGESCPARGRCLDLVGQQFGVCGKTLGKIMDMAEGGFSEPMDNAGLGHIDGVYRQFQREQKNKFEFYCTPEPVTRALLQRERFKGSIWEPACGKGHIAKVLRQSLSNTVIASDLKDYGYGKSEVYFLLSTTSVDNIITNPPFSEMLRFKMKALQLAKRKVVLLMYCKQLGAAALPSRVMKTRRFSK